MSVPSPPIISHAPLATDQTLEFVWGRPASDGGSQITGYRFQIDSSPPISQDLNENTFYYMVTSLTNGQLYNASIEAQNANGYSSKALFRVFAPGSSSPNPPATATATLSGTSNAIVNWTPPAVLPNSAIFWYVIRSVSTNPSDPVLSASANGITDRSILMRGLNTNSSYTFTIQAVNCPGYSSALTTNSIGFITSNANLILWLDSRSNASYPGSGSTWSNLVTTRNTINYALSNSPTTSNVTYNGVATSGMSFNGTNQFAVNTTNLQAILDNNNRRETREIWFYWRGGNSVLQVEQGATAPQSGWNDAQITLINTGLWYSYWTNMTGYNVFNTLTSNRWNHVAYMFDNTTNTMQAYVNGTRTFSNSVPSRTYNGSEYFLALGAGAVANVQSVQSYYNGLIAVYRWYNTILTETQITNNFNAQKASFGL